MMRNSALYSAYLATTLMFMGDMNSNSRTPIPKELTDEDIIRIKKQRERKNQQLLLRQGLKIFNIEGIDIVAFNHKNALRKYNQAKQRLSEQGIEEDKI